MAAAIHNFFIEQGSSFEIIFEYLDENGLPSPIASTDCVRLKVKDNLNNYRVWKNAKLEQNTASLLIRSDDPLSGLLDNQIKWTISSVATKTYIFDNAVYSLELVKNKLESQVTKLAVGQISIIKDIFSTECEDSDFKDISPSCKACSFILPEDSLGKQVVLSGTTVTPSPGDPTITPTPSPSVGAILPTPTPAIGAQQEDLCDILCRGLDIFAQLYPGSGIMIQDASNIGGVNTPAVSSGTIPISNTGIAVNIELYINSLIHNNPSDLSMFLQPPSGDNILLSYRNKINSQQPGTTFAFSNKAQPNIYLYNKLNNDIHVNILQNEIETLPEPYGDLTYRYDFNQLINAGPGALSGNWNLFVVDHDVGLSGVINGWNLIITYNPPTYTEE